MFFVSLHSSGGFAWREMPLASGPRHRGQYRAPSSGPGACATDVIINGTVRNAAVRAADTRMNLRVYQSPQLAIGR
jgi:hypothetical protein